MKRFLCICLSFFCLNIAIHAQQSSSQADKRVDSFASSVMKELRIPGLAIGVVKDGRPVKISVYGKASLEWNSAVTTHSSFQIASVTKLLTSTLVLKAIYQGKIRLDDSVSAYIDSCPPQWLALRIRHLITHSSGIRDFRGDFYWPTDRVVRALKDSSLEYEPGSNQHYASSDFTLLGYVLERIYGKPFPQLLHDEVATPLNMSDGGFDMESRTPTFLRTDLIQEKVTTYYDWQGKMRAYKFLYPQYTYTAGGYFASITDMVNWAIGLDREILFPQSFADSCIYKRGLAGNKQADFTDAGWIIKKENGITYAGHSGGPGLGDVCRFPAEGYTFIVLCNDGELLPGLARAVASFYLPALKQAAKPEKFERI